MRVHQESLFTLTTASSTITAEATGKAPAQSLRRFQDWRLGLFIHYGLFTLLGRHEWAMYYERIPPAEYRSTMGDFTADGVDVGAWIDLAKRTGMRYACLTARHHEGFALFDSRMSLFNSTRSPARRDLVREYVQACRAAGLGVGIYYSVADWNDPGFRAGPRRDARGWDRFVACVHGQLQELMSNYGRIDYLFYDGCPPPHAWDARGINETIRRLQPGILISDRCGLDEDVLSAEQRMPSRMDKAWELCLTLNESWGYNPGDANWKTSRQIVSALATCAHNNGNMLLNIGPAPDGGIEPQAESLLGDLQRWLGRHGRAIYGTSPHPFDYQDQKLSTASCDTAYFVLHYYHGSRTVIAGIGNRVLRVRLLDGDREIAFAQDGDRLRLTGLPEDCPDPLFAVIQVQLDGPPRGVGHELADVPARYT